MAHTSIDISKNSADILVLFQRAFDTARNGNKIWDKSMAEWMAYFNVKIPNPEDIHMLRVSLGEIADKRDECYDLISSLKLAISRLNLDDFLTANESRRLSREINKKFSMAEVERRVNVDVTKITAIKKLSELYLEPLKVQSEKLKGKTAVIQSLLMSLANQMNNLKNVGINGDEE